MELKVTPDTRISLNTELFSDKYLTTETEENLPLNQFKFDSSIYYWVCVNNLKISISAEEMEDLLANKLAYAQ